MDQRYHQLAARAARRHGHVTRQDAAACGFTRRALQHAVATGRLVPVTTTVLRLPGAPDTPLARLWSAVLDSGPVAVVSHDAAAWLWGIPGFDSNPSHITRLRSGSHRQSRICVVHHTGLLPVRHVRDCRGLPATSPARTLFDLAGTVHPKRLERAVDTALARNLVAYGDLAEVTHELAAHGRSGGGRMRDLLESRDPASGIVESELEARFRDLLRRHGLPQPERQVVLGSDSERAGRVDCVFRQARLVVELDGRPYHSSKLDRLEDGRRDLVLLRGGFRVLRLTWHHVVEREAEVVAALQELLSCAA